MATEGRTVEPTDRPPEIVIDSTWGYRRLAEMPEASAMDRFYESHYRDSISKSGRAGGLERLIVDGPAAEREREWLRATLYADVLALVEEGVPDGAPRRSLDVGCGTGDLVSFLADAGWDASGTEPSAEIGRASCRERV